MITLKIAEISVKDAGKGLGQAAGAPLPGQHLCFHQRPDALLEKEGVPLGAIDQKLLEGL